MLLRSWLADWHQSANRLRTLVGTNPARRRANRANIYPEPLEQRCLLTTIDLGNLGSDGITIFGAEAVDRSGYSVSDAGDVNGDGFDDLLIGADHADAAGNLKSYAGDTYLIFGGPTLPATIDLANLGPLGMTIFGAGVSDLSGRSVSSAGDVNGDNFDDLLIGASGGGGSGNNKQSSGEACIVFGKASMPSTLDLANLGAGGMKIFGIDAFDETGRYVSNAGDVNGDGLDDVIIGAFASAGKDNGGTYVGETYVVFGSQTLPATIELANLGTAGVTIFGIDSEDFSGVSVSGAGDVNGDGFDDLLIGAHDGDALNNNKVAAGEAYVIFGGDSLPATIELANLGNDGITIFGADAIDHNGYSVSAAGDVNGDGFDDFLIGAFTADGPNDSRGGAGETYLIFGAQTLPFSLDVGDLGTAGITIVGVDATDYSGQAVSGAGDVNGDGFDDLLIGALLADGQNNATSYAGEAYVVFGGNSLPSTIDLASLGNAGITIFAIDANDNAGHRVSTAGDVNGDGFDDIIIGARFGDGPNNGRTDAGESYVVFGTGIVKVNGPAVTWAKKQPPVVVLPQIVVNSGFEAAGSTLTLSVNAVGSKKKLLDEFSIPATNGLGTTAGPQFANGHLTLAIQLNANATAGSIQSFLRGITFATKGKGLKTLTRTMEVALSNANGPLGTTTQTINVRKKA